MDWFLYDISLRHERGAKRLQSNSDFMNKIKERFNTTVELGALFITILAGISMKTRKQRASDNINHSRLFKGNKLHQISVKRTVIFIIIII